MDGALQSEGSYFCGVFMVLGLWTEKNFGYMASLGKWVGIDGNMWVYFCERN